MVNRIPKITNICPPGSRGWADEFAERLRLRKKFVNEPIINE